MATATDSDDLDKIRHERTNLRRIFTRKINEVKELMRNDAPDVDTITALSDVLTDKVQKMFYLDNRVYDILVNSDAGDDSIDHEVDLADEYRLTWLKFRSKVDNLPNTQQEHARSVDYSSCKDEPTTKKYFHFPKLELKKFDGEVKNWIGFWGQFQKIHNDTQIDNYDKFQYLIQAMEENTSARTLVESFPPSAENYEKALKQLKDRFARDNLLVEVYVRDLLNLVLSQAKKNHQLSLTALYDSLTTQLRALESLGVTSDKYAAMLLPLVESALPEEILKAYERYRVVDNTPQDDTGKQLTKLLIFLQREVESNQRISIARSTLTGDDYNLRHPGEPTASCLVAGETKPNNRLCIWCDKNSHSSAECSKFTKWSLEERNAIIKKKRGCTICLRTGHHAKICKVFIKCLVCSRRHNTVMCPDLNKTDKKQDVKKEIKPASSTEMSASQANTVTLLQTLIVNIVHNNKHTPVRALIDSGAQRSYIKKDVAEKLQLQPKGEQSLTHCVFGGIERETRTHKLYDINIESLDRSFQMKVSTLDEVKICGTLPRVYHDLATELRRFNIAISDTGDITEIGLLIGADFASYIMTGTVLHIKDGLVAINTKLGWTIQGKSTSVHYSANTACCSTNTLFCQSDFNITDLWNLETIGITDKSTKSTDEEILQNFDETITINCEGRYEVPLPWKEAHIPLSTNRALSEKRLHSTTKRLNATNNYDAYDNVFKEWLELGIIERVGNDDGKGHYLPHHAVIKEASVTTRTRPVFDASARDKNGLSLNSCLEKGANLIELIPILLTNFRLHAVGVTSDICKAFLQISIMPRDRNYLKFLWWSDGQQHDIVTYRHCRVVFGLTCSPFLLAATLKYHLEHYDGDGTKQKTAQKLVESFYVDNCVASFETEQEVSEFILEARDIMSTGMFDLRCWVTAPMTMSSVHGIVSVLGLRWDTNSDELYCNVGNMNIASNAVTKRTLLSIAHRVFDPIGFTAPTSLIPKLILQRAWLHSRNWDEKLPQDIEEDFRSWLIEAESLLMCKIPRRLCTSLITDCNQSLHIFCDASSLAYASCIFLRTESQDVVTVQLVSAKARVAPTKQCVTIPRLELLAALIGSRLFCQVKKSLNTNCKTYFWSDSTVVLTWIKKDALWDTFVRNRVDEIRKVTNIDDWRHIPGSLNPADFVCRGCSPKALLQSFWWLGPAWLREHQDTWPNTQFVNNCDSNSEMKVEVSVNLSTDNFSDRLRNISGYSKIIRVLAFMIRFAFNCRHKLNQNKRKTVSFDEYRRAESILLKLTQQESFPKNTLNVKNIRTFVDKDGWLRVETKLTLCKADTDFKTPILLHAGHFISERLVREQHEILLHAGVQIMMANLRDKFWIIGVRRLAKRIVAKCLICKKYNTKPADTPFAPLPLNRINSNAAVFEICGIDLAGPLYLKSREKTYIVLFTCAVYRALHLELVDALSTNAFLMALRRFIARRGRVKIIYSDNGTNFVGSNNLFKNLDWTLIEAETQIKQIKWIFIPPTAAWWGGWWERMVRIVKEILRRVLGKASITYIEMETVLCDCESVINSRPLTYMSESDELIALTPASFLRSLPSSDTADIDNIDHKSINQRAKYVQKLRDDLRQRFRKEYLALLVHRGHRSRTTIRVGDVVLIQTDAKRINWPLGVVVELFPGVDGEPRVAKLRTTNGTRVRPFQRLYPLELVSE